MQYTQNRGQQVATVKRRGLVDATTTRSRLAAKTIRQAYQRTGGQLHRSSPGVQLDNLRQDVTSVSATGMAPYPGFSTFASPQSVRTSCPYIVARDIALLTGTSVTPTKGEEVSNSESLQNDISAIQ
jgi:hypothetical protein